MCEHIPACPAADEPCCCQAHIVADRYEQGWCRLCNGVIVFDDGVFLSPAGVMAQIPRVA
ncbi:hypothetical protein JCM18899A_50540 [Nocardioides sp. AN3]